jgi:hypothetical protein
MTTRGERIPGSARVSRAGDGVPAIANFYPDRAKACFGEDAETSTRDACATRKHLPRA